MDNFGYYFQCRLTVLFYFGQHCFTLKHNRPFPLSPLGNSLSNRNSTLITRSKWSKPSIFSTISFGVRDFARVKNSS